MQNKLKKIRISESEYNLLVEKGKKIEKETDDQYSREYKKQFFQKNQFPTITELGEHGVIFRLKEFLPYLVFYYEVYQTDDENFENTYKLLDDIFTQLVVKIDDKVIEEIENINPSDFKKMSLKERAKVFKPLMDYYYKDEFSSFLDDLGWKNFMLAYNYRKVDYNKGKREIHMEDDLNEIWNYLKKS